jgi:hypothetical protein
LAASQLDDMPALVEKFECRVSSRLENGAASKEKMFQPCALGISHDEQEINPRIIILH